jgi:hypothetical protein
MAYRRLEVYVHVLTSPADGDVAINNYYYYYYFTCSERLERTAGIH